MKELYELAGGVEHDGEKGAFREYFINELIKPYIPEHFGIGSGIVVDAYGKQSRQCDVIIYDKRLLPPILQAGNKGIYPIDNVMCVLEVKSTLQASHYKALTDAAYRLSPNNPDGLRVASPGNLENGKTYYPLYAVFGYKSDSDKSELERVKEQSPEHWQEIKLIGVLNKCVWSESGGMMLNNDEAENAITFLIHFLNRIEDTASSRGPYRLQNWLST
jgi:hypothetical protein